MGRYLIVGPRGNANIFPKRRGAAGAEFGGRVLKFGPGLPTVALDDDGVAIEGGILARESDDALDRVLEKTTRRREELTRALEENRQEEQGAILAALDRIPKIRAGGE